MIHTLHNSNWGSWDLSSFKFFFFFSFTSGLKSLIEQRGSRVGRGCRVLPLCLSGTGYEINPLSLIERCILLPFDFGTGLIFSYNPWWVLIKLWGEYVPPDKEETKASCGHVRYRRHKPEMGVLLRCKYPPFVIFLFYSELKTSLKCTATNRHKLHQTGKFSLVSDRGGIFVWVSQLKLKVFISG